LVRLLASGHATAATVTRAQSNRDDVAILAEIGYTAETIAWQLGLDEARVEAILDSLDVPHAALPTPLATMPPRVAQSARRVAEHGSSGAYKRHLKAREKPCEPCRLFNSNRSAERRARDQGCN
jgi:hypothetical protein